MAGKVDRQLGGKRAELYVIGELLKRGVVPYVPVVDVGLDALVRTPTGKIVELQVKSAGSAGGEYPRWFQVPSVEPRRNFFIIGVEARDGDLADVWVFPTTVFDKYAGRPPKGSPRDLDLDIGARKYGIPLRELLCGFRNRWELITNFENYEALMESPEDLEDILTMKEATEAPEEEVFTLEKYERRRSAALSS